MDVVYVNRMVARLLSNACSEMPFARISWFSTSVQYNDWLGVYTKLKIQPKRNMEKMPTPEMAFEGVLPWAVAVAT
jgi:hypothetical protein